jgi:hypothetical protein
MDTSIPIQDGSNRVVAQIPRQAEANGVEVSLGERVGASNSEGTKS